MRGMVFGGLGQKYLSVLQGRSLVRKSEIEFVIQGNIIIKIFRRYLIVLPDHDTHIVVKIEFKEVRLFLDGPSKQALGIGLEQLGKNLGHHGGVHAVVIPYLDVKDIFPLSGIGQGQYRCEIMDPDFMHEVI